MKDQIRNWILALIATCILWGSVALFFKYPAWFFIAAFIVAIIFTICMFKCLLIDELMKPQGGSKHG